MDASSHSCAKGVLTTGTSVTIAVSQSTSAHNPEERRHSYCLGKFIRIAQPNTACTYVSPNEGQAWVIMSPASSHAHSYVLSSAMCVYDGSSTQLQFPT